MQFWTSSFNAGDVGSAEAHKLLGVVVPLSGQFGSIAVKVG